MKSLTEQLKAKWLSLLIMYVPVILVLSYIQFLTPIPMDKLTKDWASAVKVPFYWGAISNIGILLWWASAAICLFSYFLLRKKANKNISAFFAYAGIFSAVLAIDDFFFFHDIIFPQKLGIMEESIFVIYFIIFAIFLIKFRQIILKGEARLFLLLAAMFFVFSLLVDIPTHNSFTKHFTFTTHHYLEDGNKLLGIISWLAYFAVTAYYKVLEQNNQPRVVIAGDSQAEIDEKIVTAVN